MKHAKLFQNIMGMGTDCGHETVKRVLIYRLGSLGDTVIALPCFHLIAKAFPNADRRVLTNYPVASKAPPLESILSGSGLIHGCFAYPLGLRRPTEILRLRREIQEWQPDVVIYIAAYRGFTAVLRDYFFFKLCGIKQIIGVPWARANREPVWRNDRQCYEYEAERLARCLTKLGDARIEHSSTWDMSLSALEIKHAMAAISVLGKREVIACSVGTKMEVKDWGELNWLHLLDQLAIKYPDHGLAMIGSADERDLSDRVAVSWNGRVVNLCGGLTPRESAAILKQSKVFVGHDSGPMHLAAAVSVPCVAIFSARSRPGIWFPYGLQHRVFYKQTECYNCNLVICEKHNKKCIDKITASEIINAIVSILD